MKKYIITGVLKTGERFDPIHTSTPWNYNVWRGSIWEMINGKRKLIKRISN